MIETRRQSREHLLHRGDLKMEMKNYKKDRRKLKQQEIAQPLLSVSSSNLLKPLAGNVPLKDPKNVERGFVKNYFRYPHKVQCTAAPEHIIQEQPVVRRITVDLRPVLRDIDLYEEDGSDTENECNSISTAALSDQGLNGELYLPSTSLPDQDSQSEKSSFSTSGLLEKRLNRRYVSLEESPSRRNSEAISFSLPILQNCECCEQKSKPAQKSQRSVKLVEMNTRTFTFDKAQQFSVSSPVLFPKIILKELPSQNMSKEQRPSPNENTSWLGLEELQLPISELVRMVKEQTNSQQHTLITKVLCSLREKQEKGTFQHVGELERTYKEPCQKIPQIPCGGAEIRLTWMKRS